MGNTCVAVDAGPDARLYPDAAPDVGTFCGPGTHQVGDECLPDTSMPGFEVRVAETIISADGYQKIAVLALGPDLDGGVLDAQVQLTVVPANAGTIDQAVLTLTQQGTGTFLTPCNSVLDPSCVEPFQIVMTPVGDPQTILATSALLESVAPTPVGSAAPCLAGGNLLYVDGNDFVWNGTTLVQGQFTFQPMNTPTQVFVSITTSYAQGSDWQLMFGTYILGTPLRAQIYPRAERFYFEAPGNAGLTVDGDGRGCNVLSGSFQIEELVLDSATPPNIQRFTATFIQHCEDDLTTRLTGCIHVEQ